MVKSILSTFDDGIGENSRIRLYRSLVGTLSNLPGLSRFSGRDLSRWERLFTALSGMGIEIETYQPSGRDLEHELEILEEKFQSTDLIFHSEWLMKRDPSVSDELAERVNQLLNERYRHKSHLTSPDKFYIAKKMEEAGIPIPETMEVAEYLAERSDPVVIKYKHGIQGQIVLKLDKEQIESR